MGIVEKVMSFIELYGTFTSNVKFAEAKLREIIDFSWLAKDMGILTEEHQKIIHDYAIDMIIELKK